MKHFWQIWGNQKPNKNQTNMTEKENLKRQLAELEDKTAELRKSIENLDNQKITDRVRDYTDILNISGVRESDDKVSIKGFDSEENKLVENLIKKIRTVKVLNEGWIPKRGEKRWYPWYNVSSGFSFCNAGYDDDSAYTCSAARLCLKSRELVLDYDKKFRHIEEAIIGVR